MRVAITGGAGFIGQELTRQLYSRSQRIVIVSRSESRQANMKAAWPEYPDNIMRYMIGDVRDTDRMESAFKGCDCVIHAAALKRVEVCEYDPQEAIHTNVIGTMNVATACVRANVEKAILISTDKAVEPITLYGATKFAAERYWIAANNLRGRCKFSACRYANVAGSTGSVLPLWKKQADNGEPLTITDKRMSRMWIEKEEAAAFVLDCLDKMQGGEVFIPDLKGKRMVDLAKEITDNPQFSEIGLRPAEKLHEILISEADARDCWKTDNGYTIYPPYHDWVNEYNKTGCKMQESFRLSSNS